jgi:hypothetical protein
MVSVSLPMVFSSAEQRVTRYPRSTPAWQSHRHSAQPSLSVDARQSAVIASSQEEITEPSSPPSACQAEAQPFRGIVGAYITAEP